MRKPPRKTGPADTSGPDPFVEAKSCLKIAQLNGGIPKMRELIAISPAEKMSLERMAAQKELSGYLVMRSVWYREVVLSEFDRLVEVRNTKQSTEEK